MKKKVTTVQITLEITKVLRDLHALGLLTPIRTCEYKLAPAGQAWLDNHRRPL